MDWNDRIERLTPWAGLLGAALLIAAGGTWLVIHEFTAVVQILIAVGVALLVYWAIGSLGTIRAAATSRTTRYGSNTLLAVLAFFIVLGLLNFLSTRYSTRWDLTRTQQFTLAPQTDQILNQIQQPVKITAFYTSNDPRKSETEDLMKQYTAKTDKINITYIDPEAQPALARQMGVRVSGTLVFEQGQQRTEVTSVTESSVSGALLKVSSTEQKKIYLTNANGELDSSVSDAGGFSTAKSQLERLNYQVATLNLLTTPTVPADAAAVVVAGPRRPFSDAELKALTDYLDAGGDVMVMVNPSSDSGIGTLLQKYGLIAGTGIVIDPALSLPQDVRALVVQQYQFSAITRDLGPTVFPLATAITRTAQTPAGLNIFPLFQSSAQSWLSRNPSAGIQFTQGDVRGPLDVAQTVEKVRTPNATPEQQKQESLRLLVIGNADFASNQFISVQNLSNLDLFLNSVNWLAEEESLISIAPKPPDTSAQMLLTPIQQNLITLSSVIFLPLAVLGAGATVWWTRR